MRELIIHDEPIADAIDKIRSKARSAAWKFHDGDPSVTRYSSFRSKGSQASQRPVVDEERTGAIAENGNYTLSPEQTHEENVQGDVKQQGEVNALQSTALDSASGEKPVNQAEQDTTLRKRRLRSLFQSQKSLQRAATGESKTTKFTVWGQVKTVLFGSWINVLLICVPIGIALHAADVNPYASFAINFVAILPLAGMLSFATEEIALRTSEVIGGLLNASFGNAVELIVSVIALTKHQIIIVQTSLIGSILSNLLLVLGMCFFFGGFKRLEQHFNVTVAQTAASLLALAVGSLIIPTCFVRFGTAGSYEERLGQVTKLSRGESVILLIIYLAYLFFQLKSHSILFSETGAAGTKRQPKNSKPGMFNRALGVVGANQSAHAGGTINQAIFNPQAHEEQTEDDEEEPQLSLIGAIVTLCVATAFIGVTSEFMVDGITPVAQFISPEFIGLILIPIVGNAAEHATAVTVAIKDKMDLAIGVAVGSSMQIALLIFPLVVIIGWIIGEDDMNLMIDGFLIAIVFVAVLLVNYLIGDGSSHWLEGVMLMMLYVIIAVAAYLYPANPDDLAPAERRL